jgi:hypothetical protein
MSLNGKLMDALQMYHHLMKELPAYGYGTTMAPVPGTMPTPGPSATKMMMNQPPPEYYSLQQQPQVRH